MNDLFNALEGAMRSAFGQWLKPVQHADAVIQVYPVWASAKTLRALVGLNRQQLDRFCVNQQVRAKFCGGSVIYHVQDVLDCIDKLPNRGKEVNHDS